MADTLDCLESRSNISAAAAETVELDTSREDVRVVLEGSRERVSEGALESKGALDLLVALVLVGLASSVVAAVALAVLLTTTSPAALSEAVARDIALISRADLNTKELVAGHDLRDDVSHHAVDLHADPALSLELSEVSSSGLKLVVKLGKLVGDEVLRDSSGVLDDVHLTAVGSLDLSVLHEAKEGVLLEAQITVLARAGGRAGVGIVIGILEDGAEVDVHAVRVDGVDPAMRPAGSDVGAELGILEASIGGGRGGSRGGNVDVGRELLVVEHGARVASRHEEDELLEHLLLLPGLNALSKIVIVEELVSGHGDDARVAVIIVEDEDVIVLGGLQSLARARGGGVARKNVDEVLEVGLLGDVILDDTLINVDVGATLDVELVEDLAGEGVLRVVGDIILEEGDDALVGDASLVGKLVGLAHGGLVTIVAPASATGDENDPGVATLSLAGGDSLLEHVVHIVRKHNCEQSKCNNNSLHCYLLTQKTNTQKRRLKKIRQKRGNTAPFQTILKFRISRDNHTERGTLGSCASCSRECTMA